MQALFFHLHPLLLQLFFVTYPGQLSGSNFKHSPFFLPFQKQPFLLFFLHVFFVTKPEHSPVDTIGLAVGLAVGLALGLAVGLALGLAVGLLVGDTVGALVEACSLRVLD
jgi:hypothetical protein